MTSLPVEFKNIRKLVFYLSPNIFDIIHPIFESLEKCNFTSLPIFNKDVPEFGIKQGMYVLEMDKRDFRDFKKWSSHYGVTSFKELMTTLNKKLKVGQFFSLKIVRHLQRKIHLDTMQVIILPLEHLVLGDLCHTMLSQKPKQMPFVIFRVLTI